MTQCLRAIPSASVSETLPAYEKFAVASRALSATACDVMRRLGYEDRRTRGLAAFHRFVCLRSILERIFLVDWNFYRARTDNLEQIGRYGHQILALGSVIVERRPRCKKRTLGLQDVNVEGVDLTRRAPKAHEIAKWAQAIERSRERGLADAIVDDVAELAAGDLFHPRNKILVPIKNCVMAAVLFGKFGLVLGADSANNSRPKIIGPLTGDESDAARRSVYQADGTFLDFVSAIEQILHCHAFEHHAGSLFV